MTSPSERSEHRVDVYGSSEDGPPALVRDGVVQVLRGPQPPIAWVTGNPRPPRIFPAGDYSAVVEMGPDDGPYWWLLCPSAATLQFSHEPRAYAGDCSTVCGHDAEHAELRCVVLERMDLAIAKQEGSDNA